MKVSEFIREIILYIGGVNNILGINHCSTRLRFDIDNLEEVDISALNRIPKVVEAFYRAGQVQIIIGDDVNVIYKELLRTYDIPVAYQSRVEFNNDGSLLKGTLNKLMSTLVGIFQPIVPAIIGAGMIKAGLLLFVSIHFMDKSDDVYQLLNLISDSIYYFLPILLALSCSYKFNTNSFLSISIAGVLVYPELLKILLTTNVIEIAGIDLSSTQYASSIIPIILTIWMMSYVERLCDHVIPSMVAIFLKPVVILIVIVPISLTILGPVGNHIGGMLSNFTVFVQREFGWFANALLAACMPFFVMFGIHKIFYPIVISAMTKTGYDTLVLTAMLASNVAQGAGALTVWLFTQRKSLKQIALPAGIAALFGITEVALYSVHLKMRQAFVCCMIGAATSGLLAGILGLKAYANLAPGLVTLPMFIDDGFNFQYSLIVIFTSILVTSVSIYLWNLKTGFLAAVSESDDIEKKNIDDIENRDEDNRDIKDSNTLANRIVIFSPMFGELRSLNEVKNDDWIDNNNWKGVGILPSQGIVRAPFDGIVTSKSVSNHSINLTSIEGVELMICIGVNEDQTSSDLFFSYANVSDYVELGDKLIEFNIEKAIEHDMDIFSVVIVTNSSDYFDVISSVESNSVKPSKPLLTIL
ncbi:PTS transporter subunit EIIC [Vibrio gazogenes]|uniref:PTS system, beta-glucosides-specific IIC component n=1 Tax=Vibrio gazogenes DSM 21264 = NBRC 103151 TaxID=1123492 RepID=A0A1M4TBC7_VIBGA|nr:PTS transporter subunit EIIC [Vibrio gazogenes]USP16055.1 PTS transporter subunit EIIC [Vibrio gazogenes]SHE41698.1 PTS system, beta-glucosides-specific IIC component [Vibrio gazogenes DSM 21264] [Vibrio gazogenes DSM 21264 = NBRC 103151]SJN54288.1 PTS system beta-glucoside-specific EIIBCA component [Vibrio gazogenes]